MGRNRDVFFGLIASILSCTFLSGNSTTYGQKKKDEDNENRERLIRFDKDCQKYKLPAFAREMKLAKSFPKENLFERGIFVWEGTKLFSDKKGDIYVADGKQNAILKFDKDGTFIKTYGRSGEGPGDLNLPLDIEIDKSDNLHILDQGNMRIQVFNFQGDYVKSFKIFRPYLCFEIFNGKYYLPKWDTTDAEDNVIDILDDNGHLMGAIADQIDMGSVVKERWARHPRMSYISINQKGEIYLAWRFFAEVQKYSADGKLLADYNIDYNKIADWSQHNEQIYTSPQKEPRFKTAISAIQANETGLYIFSPYPRIEILEYLDNGQAANLYWSRNPKIFECTDFLVQRDQDKLRIYVLFRDPLSQISLYTVD